MSASANWLTLAGSVNGEVGSTGVVGAVDEGSLSSTTVDAREELLLFRRRFRFAGAVLCVATSSPALVCSASVFSRSPRR